MKKIINAPENVVNEMLSGLVAANPDKLELIPEMRIVKRKEKKAEGKYQLGSSMRILRQREVHSLPAVVYLVSGKTKARTPDSWL